MKIGKGGREKKRKSSVDQRGKKKRAVTLAILSLCYVMHCHPNRLKKGKYDDYITINRN